MRNDCETKVYENHAQDSRIRELDGYSPAVPAKAGTGGQPPARPRPDGGRAMRDGAVGVDLYNAQVTGGGVGDAPPRQLGRGPRPVRDCLAVRTANTGANGCGVAVEVCHTLDLASGQGVLVNVE